MRKAVPGKKFLIFTETKVKLYLEFLISGLSAVCNGDTGQCNCKLCVTGASCNRCKPGYCGLSAGNPSGCSACNCDLKGTVGNSGKKDLDKLQ